MMLNCLFTGASSENDINIKYIAGIILKNSIKTFYAELSEIFDMELIEIEFVCFLMLVNESMGYSNIQSKLWVELNLIIS